MLLKERIAHLKNDIDHCLDSTLYCAMYRCIVIHQRQYNISIHRTHCVVTTIIATVNYFETDTIAICTSRRKNLEFKLS